MKLLLYLFIGSALIFPPQKSVAGSVTFGISRGTTSVDSIPDSLFMSEAYQFKLIEDIELREAKYKEMLKRFPVNRANGRANEFRRMRLSLAVRYATNGNARKTREYYDQVKVGIAYAHGVTIGSNLIENKLYSEGLSILNDVMPEVSKGLDNGDRTFALIGYDHYASALYYTGKKEDGLKAIRYAYEKSDRKNTEVNTTYATILNGLGMHREALPIMEQLVHDGKATKDVKALFHESYMKVHGDETAFNERVTELTRELSADMKRKAAKELMDEAAFPFLLKDLNGKIVSLSDLKGKVVVLDFWATWCVPCLQSMPSMQKLVDKYKDDPNVQFYFIDTSERIPDYEAVVRRILKEKGFNFQVLFDPLDKASKSYPATKGFKVTGLPTKIVLDGNSRIRYRVTGFDGEEATIAEFTSMIERAKEM